MTIKFYFVVKAVLLTIISLLVFIMLSLIGGALVTHFIEGRYGQAGFILGLLIGALVQIISGVLSRLVLYLDKNKMINDLKKQLYPHIPQKITPQHLHSKEIRPFLSHILVRVALRIYKDSEEARAFQMEQMVNALIVENKKNGKC